MSNAATNVSEYAAIADVVQQYIDGAKSGKGDEMKPREVKIFSRPSSPGQFTTCGHSDSPISAA